MANIIQTILIREDLNLPVGLLAAQVFHIGMEPWRQALSSIKDTKDSDPLPDIWDVSTKGMIEHLGSPYIHVKKVPNKEVLEYFIDKAQRINVRYEPWHDTINLKVGSQTLVFENVLVGISFVPQDADRIKAVIGDLPFL